MGRRKFHFGFLASGATSASRWHDLVTSEGFTPEMISVGSTALLARLGETEEKVLAPLAFLRWTTAASSIAASSFCRLWLRSNRGSRIKELAVTREPKTANKRTVDLTFIGGPTILIEIGGFRLLTDPTFDGAGQYMNAEFTITKTGKPAITPDELGAVDIVLLSHDQHADNLDHRGRAYLPRVRSVLTTTERAPRLGGNAVGLKPWQEVAFGGGEDGRLFVTATPARHGPANFEHISGEVTGFVIGVERPGDAIYVTGDTVWYEGIAEVAKRFDPKLVILFAGSAKPHGPFHVTMDNSDALETANAFETARIIAIHNEGWEHFTEDANEIRDSFRALGYDGRLIELRAGIATSIEL